MSREKRILPKLDNATPGFIVDELGKAREQEKEAKFWVGFYKDQLRAKFPNLTEDVMGEVYCADVVEVVQERFDTERFKADYPELYQEYKKTVEFEQVKTSKIVPKPKKDKK